MHNREPSDMKSLMSVRHLAWPRCYNARDLGGLPAKDGKETRWGAVIRSDILNRLTEEGQLALFDYGIRTIIDLRSLQEAAGEPSIFVKTDDHSLAYMNLPLEKYYPHVSVLITQAQTVAEVYCIILDHYPDAVSVIMRAIIGARPGGIVLHCHSGKDRTGIVSALLLSLAGVSNDVIAADYAESQECLMPLYDKIVKEAGGEDKMDFWSKPIVPREMMFQMLGHLEARYGGAEEYLREAGLSPEEIRRLKSRLCST